MDLRKRYFDITNVGNEKYSKLIDILEEDNYTWADSHTPITHILGGNYYYIDENKDFYVLNYESKPLLITAGYTLITVDEIIEGDLPKSWEEFCKMKPSKVGEYYITANAKIGEYEGDGIRDSNDTNLYPNKSLAIAALSLAQLIQLAEVYNRGWMPSWKNINQTKYVINNFANRYTITPNTHTHGVLAFKTIEVAELFLNTFTQLIVAALPLL